ncbi:MAG: fluoride efflux transporter CrcB [Rhodothermia bacterium]
MKYLVSVLLVGTGGFIGSAARYAAGGVVHRLIPGVTFPWGTVVVNVLGCFLIGVVAALTMTRQLLTPETRLLVMVGILGGFTTFSTFGYETFALLRDGEPLRALANASIQVIAGLVAVWLGYSLAR